MNKSALVTGAGSGLGRSIVCRLANAGYDVGIHTGSNEARAYELAKQVMRNSNCRAEVIISDFSKENGAGELFEQYKQKFESLDLFINNAGVSLHGKILDMTEELYDQINNINFKNAYFSVQEAARLMIEKKTSGHIVLISSNHHATVMTGMSCYAITKESLVKYTKHAAMEFARYGIRVNCLAPGWVNTGEDRMKDKFEKSVGKIPMHRWVEPEEIAEWILFMTGANGASLTGAVIDLDGGVRLMSGGPEAYGL